jgi:hypothetical protein
MVYDYAGHPLTPFAGLNPNSLSVNLNLQIRLLPDTIIASATTISATITGLQQWQYP